MKKGLKATCRPTSCDFADFSESLNMEKITSSQIFLTLAPKIHLKVILHPDRPKKVPERYGSKNMNCFNNEKKGLKQTCRPTNSDFAEFYPLFKFNEKVSFPFWGSCKKC